MQTYSLAHRAGVLRRAGRVTIVLRLTGRVRRALGWHKGVQLTLTAMPAREGRLP